VFLEEEKLYEVVMENSLKKLETIKITKKKPILLKQKKTVWYAVNLLTIMQFILVVIIFVAGNVSSNKE